MQIMHIDSLEPFSVLLERHVFVFLIVWMFLSDSEQTGNTHSASIFYVPVWIPSHFAACPPSVMVLVDSTPKATPSLPFMSDWCTPLKTDTPLYSHLSSKFWVYGHKWKQVPFYSTTLTCSWHSPHQGEVVQIPSLKLFSNLKLKSLRFEVILKEKKSWKLML